MSKIAVVYWSGTGNTRAMAEAVAEGARIKGGDVSVMGPADFTPELVGEYGAIAFGCPSMGAEVLEETEFEPMFASVLPSLNGRKVALFGSWGWGGGAYMIDWENRCREAGADLTGEGLTCQEAPDAETLKACRELGGALV